MTQSISHHIINLLLGFYYFFGGLFGAANLQGPAFIRERPTFNYKVTPGAKQTNSFNIRIVSMPRYLPSAIMDCEWSRHELARETSLNHDVRVVPPVNTLGGLARKRKYTHG